MASVVLGLTRLVVAAVAVVAWAIVQNALWNVIVICLDIGWTSRAAESIEMRKPKEKEKKDVGTVLI